MSFILNLFWVCFSISWIFSSHPQLTSGPLAEWVSYLMTHFAGFDLSVPVANWFWVLGICGHSSGYCLCGPKDLQGTICELCVRSKYFLDRHRAGPMSTSSLMSPGACGCLCQPKQLCCYLQIELASCFQKVVVIPGSSLNVSFHIFHLFIFLKVIKIYILRIKLPIMWGKNNRILWYSLSIPVHVHVFDHYKYVHIQILILILF